MNYKLSKVPIRNYVPDALNCFKSNLKNLKNDPISFLDVLLNKLDGLFSTDLYRKPTFTGLSTRFNSVINYKFIINLISYLLERAYNICSSHQS